MNYLTHFHFNTLQPVYASASDEFHFGVALPDILSVYDRTLRFHPSKITGQEELWLGIHNHMDMDTFFHRSVFFKNSYEAIRIILNQSISPAMNIRPFFLAHVLVEILLDHLLLLRSSNLALRFYRTIGSVNVTEIVRLLERHFERKLEGLEDLINKFLVTRFLESYIQLDQLIFPVNRMLTRTRQQPFELTDNSIVNKIFEPSLDTVTKNFPMLTDQFNKTFMNSQF